MFVQLLLSLLLTALAFFRLSAQEQNLNQPVQDQEKNDDRPVTGTLAFVTDYRDRGISQTMRRPAVQGMLMYQHKSGFYVMTSGSNVDGTGNFINNASMEWDFFLGCRGHKLLNTPIEIDTGFQIYYYPGGKSKVPKNVRYDMVEFYAQFTYKDFNVTFHQTVTDYSGINSNNPPIDWNTGRFAKHNGHSIGSYYIEANWNKAIGKKWKLTLHAGYQSIVNYPELNFFDWQAVATYQFEWFDFSLSVVGATGKKAFYNVPDNSYRPRRVNLAAPAAVASLTKSF